MIGAASNRRAAGWRSRRLGQNFEAIFSHMAARDGCSVIRIPDGCKQIKGGGPKNRPRLIQVKTPFDWILRSPDGDYAFIDTKSFDSDRIIYSQLDHYQVNQLRRLENPAIAGYVVAFRPINLVVFFSAFKLEGLQPRTNLLPQQGVSLGGLEYFSPRLLWRSLEAK